MTTATKADRVMTLELASYAVRRKPQRMVEWNGFKAALEVMVEAGMDQAEIEREAMRPLTYAEEIMLIGIIGL